MSALKPLAQQLLPVVNNLANTLPNNTPLKNTQDKNTLNNNTPANNTLANNTLDNSTVDNNTLSNSTTANNTLDKNTGSNNTLDTNTLVNNTLANNTLNNNTLDNNTLANNTLVNNTLTNTTSSSTSQLPNGMSRPLHKSNKTVSILLLITKVLKTGQVELFFFAGNQANDKSSTSEPATKANATGQHHYFIYLFLGTIEPLHTFKLVGSKYKQQRPDETKCDFLTQMVGHSENIKISMCRLSSAS